MARFSFKLFVGSLAWSFLCSLGCDPLQLLHGRLFQHEDKAVLHSSLSCFLWGGGGWRASYLVMLKGSPWICTKELLRRCSGDHLGGQGPNPTCKARALSLLLSLWPLYSSFPLYPCAEWQDWPITAEGPSGDASALAPSKLAIWLNL